MTRNYGYDYYTLQGREILRRYEMGDSYEQLRVRLGDGVSTERIRQICLKHAELRSRITSNTRRTFQMPRNVFRRRDA